MPNRKAFNRKVWGLLALLPLAACNTGATNALAPSTLSAPGLGTQDRAFVTQAASGDAFETRSATLAVQKARRPAVRAYAQRLLEAHTASGQTLGTLAAGKDIALPPGPDAAQERTLADLQGAGAGFDAAFITAQLAAHRTAIAAFQAQADNGADPALKSFARTALPDLKAHLAMAERLRGGR